MISPQNESIILFGVILTFILVTIISWIAIWKYYQNLIDKYEENLMKLSKTVGRMCLENEDLREQSTQIIKTIFTSKLGSEIVESMSAEHEDKIIGLESDLDAAVEMVWKHGDDNAHEWVRLNYPKVYLAKQMVKNNDQSEK